MAELAVSETTVTKDKSGAISTSAEFVFPERSWTITFTHDARWASGAVNPGDVWFPIALLAAMRRGLDLRVDEPVSAELLINARNVQALMTQWYPDDFSHVSVTGEVGRKRSRLARALDSRVAATCFTGGIDSFYTFFKRQDEVRRLVYAYGLDLSKGRVDQVAESKARLGAIATSAGVDLMTLETNAKFVLGQQGVDWGTQGHGAVLASIGHLTSAEIGRLYIPASHSYENLFRWGSHPLLDPLWRTASLDIVHDGVESSRAEKVAAVAHRPAVREHLRVCLSGKHDANCGQCQKCVRTMLSLHILGELEANRRFPTELSPALVSALEIESLNDLAHMEDNLAWARRRGVEDDIIAALATLTEAAAARLRS